MEVKTGSFRNSALKSFFWISQKLFTHPVLPTNLCEGSLCELAQTAIAYAFLAVLAIRASTVRERKQFFYFTSKKFQTQWKVVTSHIFSILLLYFSTYLELLFTDQSNYALNTINRPAPFFLVLNCSHFLI